MGFLPHFHSTDGSAEELWTSFADIVKSEGFAGAIMVFSPRLRARQHRAVYGGEGFPAEALNHYLTRQMYRADPMLAAGAKRLLPFAWEELEREERLSWRHRPVTRMVHENDLIDVCALPMFGPAGWSGQIVLRPASGVPAPRKNLLFLQGVAQTLHNSMWDLGWGGRAPRPELSARERSVLHWITRGKSNAAIASIFNLSIHTIDTYQRRLYAKLGATDRVSAAVKAIALGLADVVM